MKNKRFLMAVMAILTVFAMIGWYGNPTTVRRNCNRNF